MPHSIILKTEQSRLEACSAEPIRTPGTIQPHGALLGINRETRLIVVVSENSEEFLGVGPERVLGRTIEEFVGEAAVPALRNAVTGANPVRVEVNGLALDAIVHRTLRVCNSLLNVFTVVKDETAAGLTGIEQPRS